jgi:cytochrome P450
MGADRELRAQLPPGPSSPVLLQGAGQWTRPLAFLERCRRRYGKRFTVRFPFTPYFVMISEPDQIKQIYTAPADVLEPGRGARVLEPIVGPRSVILLDGDAHMSQRKMMLPAFHGERMDELSELVRSVTESEISGWALNDTDRDLHRRFQALTLEIILRAVFGLEPGPRLDRLRDALTRLLSFGDSPLTLIPAPSDRALRISSAAGPLKGFLKVRERVDELLFEQIEERRLEGSDRPDVLSMLLEARHDDGTPMSDRELRDELMTLLVAGHETTASTLAWTVERLSREPRVLERLTAEVVDDDGDEYMVATIRESLRRRPVLPNTAPRAVMKPIEIGGWRYPAGVSVVASAYLVHHDPDVYTAPYEFRPERFLDKGPGTYTWIPFGGGRRRCLGSSFAMLESRIVLAGLLRHFRLRPGLAGPEMPRRRNITVRPQHGCAVGLDPRPPAVPVAA